MAAMLVRRSAPGGCRWPDLPRSCHMNAPRMHRVVGMVALAVTPKLVVNDARQALDYYVRTLGAQVEERHEDGGRIVHSQLRLGPAAVQVKDADAVDDDPLRLGRPGVLLQIVVADPDKVARAMVDAGGEYVFEVADREYGARAGRVRDPFGHEWLVQTPRTA